MFKVGDKVKVCNPERGAFNWVGKIIHIYPEGIIVVFNNKDTQNEDEDWVFLESELVTNKG